MHPKSTIPLLCVALALVACQVAPPAAPALPSHASTPTPGLPPSTSTPTPLEETRVDGRDVTLFVDPATTHQTIRDVTGGNFINMFSGTTAATEPVSQYNLAHLDIRVARVRMTLEEWEPVNDDADPENIQWDAFQDTQYNHATFELMQILQARGTQIIATAWDLPDWLVANPTRETNKFIPFELYPEVVECIAAWLLRARDIYGVEPEYVSFNEPDVGAYISLSATQSANLINLAGQRFAALGLRTRWLIADTANIDGSEGYARILLKHQEIRPYLGVFANHSWDADSSDQDLIDVRDFATKEGLEIWCTEAGSDPFAWRTPEDFPTYSYALKLAVIYSRVLKLTGATTMLYWEMMGSDYWINDGAQSYPSFDVIRQLGEQAPPGSVVVDTSSNTADLFWFAVQAPDHFMVYVVNTAPESKSIRVEGLPPGDYTYLQTSLTSMEVPVYTQSITGLAAFMEIPGESINLLTTRPLP